VPVPASHARNLLAWGGDATHAEVPGSVLRSRHSPVDLREDPGVTIDPRTPVIVGAGQALHRGAPGDEAPEPVALIAAALREAGADSGTGERLLRGADSVRCVPTIGWRYADAAALVASELGARPRETVQSAAIGGDGPQLLVNDTAREIAAGRLDVALLGGGEAVAGLRAAELAGHPPPWRRQDEGARPTRTVGEDRAPVNEAEAAAGLAPPVFMYALIESAVRAASGASADAHLARIAALWSRFSAVAAENPHAWIARAHTPEQIATPSPGNRLVSSPYTKLLTANIRVDMAAGLILASAGAARAAGVPRDRWVFVHAGAQAQDEWHVSERAQLAASPAIRAAGRDALRHAGVAIDEVAHVDLYSCFPAAVEIAAGELGLAIDDPGRPLTVTGGLTFAGGPGNDYSTHAIASLVPLLRADPDSYGLATALGWYLTKHAVGVYSARPPQRPFASIDSRPQQPPPRRAHGDYEGAATIEACTVPYRRDGSPEAAVVSALTPNGDRALVRTEDREVVDAILAGDPVGRPIGISGSRLAIEGRGTAVRDG
jgi:acetyl-CoA C-acetyltransferase